MADTTGTTTHEANEAVTPAPDIVEAGKNLKQHATWNEILKETPDAEAKPDGEATPSEPDAFKDFTVNDDDQLVRPDGTPADETEVEQYNAAQSKPAPAGPILVTLRGRNGDEREIEAADEETAEILRANHKDGLRGEEYRTKMAKVEEYLAERRSFEQIMETNPEALILQHLPDSKQIDVAVALLAKHWDRLLPQLNKFDGDAAARAQEAQEIERRTKDQASTFDSVREREQYIVQMERTTRALVPDHIDDATAEQFMADAGLDIGRAVNQYKRPLTPDEIPKVLTKRLALYGFDKPAPDATNGSDKATPPKRTVARAVAKPSSAATTSPTATVKPGVDAGASVRRTVTAQRVAASVPPAGAGAATLRVPMVPPGTTIEQASQALRKLPSWSSS